MHGLLEKRIQDAWRRLDAETPGELQEVSLSGSHATCCSGESMWIDLRFLHLPHYVTNALPRGARRGGDQVRGVKCRGHRGSVS